MSQIRITKTQEIEKVLSDFQQDYPLLSEVEIIKMLLSRAYTELKQEKSYLTAIEEKNLHIAMQQKKQGKGKKGTAAEAIEWLKN